MLLFLPTIHFLMFVGKFAARRAQEQGKMAHNQEVVRSVYVDWFVRHFDAVIGPGICKGHNELPPESSAPELTRRVEEGRSGGVNPE